MSESAPRGRIAALTGPNQLQLKCFPVPEAERGAMVLGVRRANVCGSDLHQFHYESAGLREAGLGHEFVGEVFDLGEGVATDYAGQVVGIGDRVVPVYYLTCQRCISCLRGEFGACRNSVSSWATNPEIAPHFRAAFATHYYVHPGQYFYKVPDALDDRAVAGANCGLAQMIFVLDQLRIQAGETLVIQGAGGVGLYAAAVAYERGAKVVIVDAISSRLELAKQFGAVHVIDMNEHGSVEDRAKAVLDLTSGVGADLVLEVAGAPAAFTEAVHLARPGGRIASVGNLNADATVEVVPGIITRKGLRIQGVLRYDPWYLHKALDFLWRRANQHPFEALTGQSFPLDAVEDALLAGESRSVARVAVVP